MNGGSDRVHGRFRVSGANHVTAGNIAACPLAGLEFMIVGQRVVSGG